MIKRSVLLLVLAICSCLVIGQNETQKAPVSVIPVAKVWAGHPVGFDILTTAQFQYACYYVSNASIFSGFADLK
jgi:hypothetical protein